VFLDTLIEDRELRFFSLSIYGCKFTSGTGLEGDARDGERISTRRFSRRSRQGTLLQLTHAHGGYSCWKAASAAGNDAQKCQANAAQPGPHIRRALVPSNLLIPCGTFPIKPNLHILAMRSWRWSPALRDRSPVHSSDLPDPARCCLAACRTRPRTMRSSSFPPPRSHRESHSRSSFSRLARFSLI
jgi:hypothetical protein